MADIILNELTKTFGQVPAVEHVSLVWRSGKIHGLVGRNGSGKTVLLKCVCGLMLPTSGSVTLGGKPVDGRQRLPVKVGAIIEQPGFLPNCSAYKNLSLLASINGVIGKTEITNSIRTVGLDPLSRKHVGKYSMGMRQRLGIAQAIMEDPDVLIFDEPMNGLDNAGVIEMRQLFMHLREIGKTIVLASHNPLDIEALCDTVCELNLGKLVSFTEKTH